MFKKRRGLSAIIGGVFMLIVITTAITYTSYSMNQVTQLAETIGIQQEIENQKIDEKFEVISVGITPTNNLTATIKNTGQLPLEINTLWLDEQNNSTDVVQKIPINQVIAPGYSFSFDDLVVIDPAKGYDMKLVTSRGEIQTFYLNSASQENLDIRLIAAPERVANGFSTTLMMIVVNNMSNNNPLVNLTPIEPDCSGICGELSGPIPASYDVLDSGETAIFEWSFELNGFNDESITFTGELQNGVLGNSDTETVTITSVQSAEFAGEAIQSQGLGQRLIGDDLIILHTETYGVPDVFAPPGAIPNPIHNYELNGDATDEMGGSNLSITGAGGSWTGTGRNFVQATKIQIVADEIPDTEYAIEMVFSLVNTGTWDRIVSFHNNLGKFGCVECGEYGLYSAADKFNFYNGKGTGGTLSDSTLTHVLIQRTASGTFELYQNGALVMSFDDSTSKEAVFFGQSGSEFSTQPATFFRDDSGENSDGFVDCIRVWDTAFSSTDANTLTSNSSTCYSFDQVAGASFQMSPVQPDGVGTNYIFNDVSDRIQWFSANVTVQDFDIPAGNWDASLRYNSDRLPPGMIDANTKSIYNNVLISEGKSDGGGGHTLHFNTDSTLARKDSGTWSTCTSLVDSGTLNGATWGATIGVNGSGAYLFDGADDYISITQSATKKICNYVDDGKMSIAGWFNSTAVDTSTRQTIFSKSSVDGGYNAWVGNVGSDGWMGFQFYDTVGASVNCWAENDYTDNNWHHFVGVKDSDTTCRLYVDGILEDTSTNGALGHEHGADESIYIGAKNGNSEEFVGVIDDIMFWNYYALTAADVTALFEYSFGDNAHKMNFFISNATGTGVTVDALATSTNYELPWKDQMAFTDVNDLWAGANYTVSMPVVELNLATENRLNFTMAYASGEPLTFRADDSALDGIGNNIVSSFIAIPPPDGPLPVFYTHYRDNPVTFYAFNAADEGVWFTYQGTRIIFNGVNGHYAGIVDTVTNGVETVSLSSTKDSPYVGAGVNADIVFHHPQRLPTTANPGESLKISPGDYEVFVYLNGYNEDGLVFVRNISLGTVKVLQ